MRENTSFKDNRIFAYKMLSNLLNGKADKKLGKCIANQWRNKALLNQLDKKILQILVTKTVNDGERKEERK